jgi:paraquat-inducible protein B
MNTPKKRQLGPRVKQEDYETLERLAAVKGCTLNYYVESVIEGHIARQQHPDGGGGVMHELVSEIDDRFAAHVQHIQNASARDASMTVKHLEKQIDALKVMIDAMIRTLSPNDHDAYVKTVTMTLQQLGPLFEHGNGKSK